MRRLLVILTVLLAVSAGAEEKVMSEAATTQAIAYTVRFPEAAQNRAEVEVRLPTGGAESVTLMMPVWTPGSYLVREYARQVETLTASDPAGAPLAAEKVAKNRWRVATGGAPEMVVRYRLYCRELSVRTNFVDAGFALLNGAPTFLTRLDGPAGEARPAAGPYRVIVELPAGWSEAVSALPRDGDAFVAADYDTLVDSPIYAGSPRVDRVPVGDAELLLVHEGGGEVWDYPRSVRDAGAIAATESALWGGFPPPRYVVFNLLTESGGGLEHKHSTVLMTSRFKARTEEGWRDWLGLLAHEMFHVWNGKRLRPRALGPFDYEAENYTRSLWFVEGVTSYYDDLVVARAGLATAEEYLGRVSKVVDDVQTTPGRLVQPLDDASYDAWIKLYRRDENTANQAISYYRKGQLVAWLLDVRLRRASGGERSLDDLLRSAYERWSGDQGYTPDDLLALVAEVGGADTAAWLRTTLTEGGELDFRPALDWFGLRFGEMEEGNGGGEKGADAEDEELPAGWLGADTEVRKGRLVVSAVRRGTPAFDAGLNADDEILALDDFRIPPDGLDERLKQVRPGDAGELLVARRGRLLRLAVTFGAEPSRPWKLEVDPEASAEAAARRAAWLGKAGETRD